ncbi:MAG: hypothetical protein L3J98_09890 [Gammaproteobacteria bacterium]|nr:hypothetical protein [Gammaproteobacteria bacterium]MCF6260446.1 hypothetical protein [Gammaproteobacteria bacterium]
MSFNLPGVKQDSDIESLFKSVGFIVVQWGHCEQSLELLVNTLHRQFSGSKLPKRKKMPRQLSSKLDFVKECALGIPELSPFQDELERLVHDFEDIKQTRHDLIHGAITDDPVMDGVFTFIRLQADSDIHEVKHFQYDLHDFPRISKILLRLGADSPKVARRIFEASQKMP